jgi:hypothetical protein
MSQSTLEGPASGRESPEVKSSKLPNHGEVYECPVCRYHFWIGDGRDVLVDGRSVGNIDIRSHLVEVHGWPRGGR